MPEGHTIHRLALRHQSLLAGSRIRAESPQGRFAEGAAQLTGRKLRDTEAHGKHLPHHCDRDRAAVRRLIDGYLYCADPAVDRLCPWRLRLEVPPSPPAPHEGIL